MDGILMNELKGKYIIRWKNENGTGREIWPIDRYGVKLMAFALKEDAEKKGTRT